MGVFFKLLIHYYYKHILSTRPDMKFSAVLLVLACAYSAYGLDCLVGKGKAAVKKACASRDTKCQGPLYKPDEGYGDATKAVEFKCGACSKVGTKAGECVDSNAALVYKEFHTNKCYKYKYNKEAKDGEKWEVEVDAQKKQVEEPCTGEKKDDVQCKKPFGEQAEDANYDVCGKCPAKSEKSCTNCDKELCNSAGALIASLVPLLALLYTLL